MQHSIPVSQLGPAGEPMAQAVQACVHCGFCLSACPTYQVMQQEMDSPRGRIYLMKGVLEGDIPLDQAMRHVDRCLGCLACETACPSGVSYRNLLSPFREIAEKDRKQPLVRRIRRWMLLRTLPHPKRFRDAVQLGRLARPLRRLLPGSLRDMLELLPGNLPVEAKLPQVTPAQGPRRARVALLAGCVQQVLDPQINLATLEVLARNGVEVVVPESQVCCGALGWHVGDGESARACARANLQAFPEDVDAIVTNAAGCGSAMHEYGLMLCGTAEQDRAERFSRRVMDVSVVLDQLGIIAPPASRRAINVAYHDACHLSHGQQVRSAPRRLLAMIPNLRLTEIPGADFCCGSAGTYNIDQPATASDLGQRKAAGILSTHAELVAAGNIGCIIQLTRHLSSSANPPRVLHTMEVLRLAYARQLC